MRAPLSWLLVLTALTLGGVVWAEVNVGGLELIEQIRGRALGTDPDTVRRAPTTPGIEPDHLVPALRALPSLESLDATRKRPLFFEGRHYPVPPPEPEQAASAGKPGPKREPAGTGVDALKLSAIVIVDNERVALIREGGAAASRQVRVGDSIGGWTLAEVRHDSVLMRREGQSEAIKLWTFEPIPAPARRSARPGRRAPRAGGARRAGGRNPAGRKGANAAALRAAAARRRAAARAAAERARKARGTRAARAVSSSRAPARSSRGERDCGLSRC